LYHKGELTDTAAEGLSPTVRETLAYPEQRVAGVVLNAVDDHLAKSEQLRLQWTVDSFRSLDALLYEARVAGRAVVITADHGHVLEEDGTRLPGYSEERWRAHQEPLAEQKMVFEGPRIQAAIGKRQVALLWSESARYCQKRNGYHGGATPQEAVVPLGVFLCVGKALEGSQPVAEYTPEWWLSPALTPVAEPVPLKIATAPRAGVSVRDARNRGCHGDIGLDPVPLRIRGVSHPMSAGGPARTFRKDHA
jgi:hypothetical protein